MKTMYLMTIAVVAMFSIIACSPPTYTPGMMQTQENIEELLTPPSQKDVPPHYFRVENEIDLYYFTQGEGEPVLVLHGGPGIPFTKPWKGLDPLHDQYRFIYYHQRGCGQSTKPITRFTSHNYPTNIKTLVSRLGITTQLADIEKIRKILKIQKISLIGHSFGGFLALLYALEFPENIHKLVLVSPADVIKMPSESGGLYEIVKKRLPEEDKTDYEDFLKRFFDYGTIFQRTEEELQALSYEFITYYKKAVGASHLTSSQRGLTKNDLGGWVQPGIFFSMGQQHDYTPYLNSMNAPVLLLYGSDDISFPTTALQNYSNPLSNCTTIKIEQATHFPFDDKPEEFAEAVATFFEG